LKPEPTEIATDLKSFPDEDDGEMIERRKNDLPSAGEIPPFAENVFR